MTRKNSKIICLLIFMSFLFSCKVETIKIMPLDMLNRTDSINIEGKVIASKTDFYLISGYTDDKKTMLLIDSFIEHNKKDYYLKYNQYEMVFYKESNETNQKNIIANPRIIDRYSQQNDLIYSCRWSLGKFLGAQKWKEGKIIEPDVKILVEPVPK